MTPGMRWTAVQQLLYNISPMQPVSPHNQNAACPRLSVLEECLHLSGPSLEGWLVVDDWHAERAFTVDVDFHALDLVFERTTVVSWRDNDLNDHALVRPLTRDDDQMVAFVERWLECNGDLAYRLSADWQDKRADAAADYEADDRYAATRGWR